MIKLQKLLKEDVLTENKVPVVVVDRDPDKTERSFVNYFEELAKGHGRIIDYGPRETDIYDWTDRSNYESAIKEYNKYMTKIANQLNKASQDMDNIWKVWGKISDKYRNKDSK
jgi:F420-0:gamma-glutamyl ligase-like protein